MSRRQPRLRAGFRPNGTVSAMTGSGLRSSRHVGGRGQALVVVALVLAALSAATLALGTDDVRWLRLGIVAALWAGLVGTIVVNRRHRPAGEADDPRTVYQLELEREVAARREHELTVERDVRTRVEKETRSDLDALRAELRSLRESLEALFGGEVLVERVALRAESTRVRSVGEDGRGHVDGRALPAGTPRPREPAAAQVQGSGQVLRPRGVTVNGEAGGNSKAGGSSRTPAPAAAAATFPAERGRQPAAARRQRSAEHASPAPLPATAASATSRPARDGTPERRTNSPGAQLRSPITRSPQTLSGQAASRRVSSPESVPERRWLPTAPAPESAAPPLPSYQDDPLFGELPRDADQDWTRSWDTSTSWEPAARVGADERRQPLVTAGTGRHRGSDGPIRDAVGSWSVETTPRSGNGSRGPSNGAGHRKPDSSAGQAGLRAAASAPQAGLREAGRGGGRRRAPEPDESATGSHTTGRPVEDLLAAYGGGAPDRHRRRGY